MVLPGKWTALTRASGLIEWVCPHGVGHPAPQEHQVDKQLLEMSYDVHGCDGCCKIFNPEEEKAPCEKCGGTMMKDGIDPSVCCECCPACRVEKAESE